MQASSVDILFFRQIDKIILLQPCGSTQTLHARLTSTTGFQRYLRYFIKIYIPTLSTKIYWILWCMIIKFFFQFDWESYSRRKEKAKKFSPIKSFVTSPIRSFDKDISPPHYPSTPTALAYSKTRSKGKDGFGYWKVSISTA